MIRKPIRKIRRLFTIFLAAALVFCGCSVGDVQIYFASDSGRNNVFKIGDMACPVKEAKVYLANYKNLYGVVCGTDMWNEDYDTATMEESLKDAVIEHLTKVYALNMYAADQEIVLDETELQQVEAAAKEYEKSLNKEEKAFTKASRKDIEKMYARYALAQKVYTQLMGNVDEDVSEDEARVMDACVLFVTDEALAKDLNTRIRNGATFERLASTYNEGEGIRKSFGRGVYSQAVDEVVFSLEEDEVSEMIPADGGYYFIQCRNKYNEELSEQNKAVIIRRRKEKALADIVAELDIKYYSHMNDKAWDKVSLKSEDHIVTNTFFTVIDQHLTK